MASERKANGAPDPEYRIQVAVRVQTQRGLAARPARLVCRSPEPADVQVDAPLDTARKSPRAFAALASA
jgi:hypothetical protein